MTIIIRPFREADRPTLRALTAEAFDGVSIDQNIDRLIGPVAARDWQWRKARHVDDDLDAHGGEIAVAEDAASGQTLGYVSFWVETEAKVGHIPNVVVHSSVRGEGLGKRLLAHALERFRAQGMAVARIETLDQNPVGQHLYPALGFREVARQIHYAMALVPGAERPVRESK